MSVDYLWVGDDTPFDRVGATPGRASAGWLLFKLLSGVYLCMISSTGEAAYSIILGLLSAAVLELSHPVISFHCSISL